MRNNKALLCGINYTGTGSALRGCINDVKNVRAYLGERFAVVNDVNLTLPLVSRDLDTSAAADNHDDDDEFTITQHDAADGSSRTIAAKDFALLPPPSKETVTVLTLTDDQTGRHVPTRANILNGIKWLVENAKADDRLFFHYSGHGTALPNQPGGDFEPSGQDQALCPKDYTTAGFIIDDDLRRMLVDPLPAGVQLRVIIDACHSASSLDLRYSYKDTPALVTRAIISTAESGENTGQLETRANVVVFSGCMDTQTSADAYWKGAWAGALTAGFLEILRDPLQKRTYRALFKRLRTLLGEKQYTQKPQLSSGKLLALEDTFDLF